MSILTSNKNRLFLAIYGLYFLVLVSISLTAQGMDPVTELDKMILQKHGYSTDTPEQVIVATKSESYSVRFMALELLTDYIAKDAIPVLKQFLNDPHITVRWHTAHLLGTLGDKSGLEQMQEDFEELAAKGTAPLPADPNMDPDMRERIENERRIALYDALEVAKVLAELGDRQGYRLATKAATKSTWEPHRDKAIYVLAEIAKADPNILSAEGKDPVSILCAMAESEKALIFSVKLITLLQNCLTIKQCAFLIKQKFLRINHRKSVTRLRSLLIGSRPKRRLRRFKPKTQIVVLISD